MISDTYKTLNAPSEGLYKEKGSRFLAFAHPVTTVQEAKTLIDGYRKTYHDARHVCFAYTLGVEQPETRSSDDGEPSGTAGRPILGQLASFELSNVLVVVVRYFGGVLLGTGGLVVAYKAAAAEALSVGEIVEKTVDVEVKLTFEFPSLNEVMKLVKKLDARILSQGYDSNCTMTLRIRKGDVERLRSQLLLIDGLMLDE